jgi:hypothetical protein
MFKNRRKPIIIIVGCAVAAIALWVALILAEPILVVSRMTKMGIERERRLLYNTDHAALAVELRNFGDQQRWQRSESNAEPQIMWPDDNSLPECLRILRPTSVAIFDDRIIFERGGPMLHFGLVVFRNGIKGEGLKELAPGVWFYADNGRVPSEG